MEAEERTGGEEGFHHQNLEGEERNVGVRASADRKTWICIGLALIRIDSILEKA